MRRKPVRGALHESVPLAHRYPHYPLHLDSDRRGRALVAGRLQRRERAQSDRRGHRRFPLPHHRTGATADPQYAAQPGRHRHFPGDPDSRPAVSPPPRVLASRLVPDAAQPWTTTADGVVVAVRLTPKGGRDAIDGIEHLADGRAVVKARVRAAAFEGAANAALVRLLPDALGVPARDVTLVAGATARIKRVKIAGDARTLAAALGRLTG